MHPGLRPLLLAAVLLSSCSIREERADCPCRLEIDLSAFKVLGGETDLRVRGEDALLLSGERTEDGWYADVPKGRYAVSAIRATEGITETDAGHIVFPEGAEPDSLYAFAESVDCFAEYVLIEALPHKQFCSVTLRERETTALLYAVRSRYGAISATDLSPLPSPLYFRTERGSDAAVRFRLPRQGAEASLQLEVSDGATEPWTLPLGEWMDKAGYDWSAPSLEDFQLEIDYTATEVRIRILDWEPGAVMTLTI